MEHIGFARDYYDTKPTALGNSEYTQRIYKEVFLIEDVKELERLEQRIKDRVKSQVVKIQPVNTTDTIYHAQAKNLLHKPFMQQIIGLSNKNKRISEGIQKLHPQSSNLLPRKLLDDIAKVKVFEKQLMQYKKEVTALENELVNNQMDSVDVPAQEVKKRRVEVEKNQENLRQTYQALARALKSKELSVSELTRFLKEKRFVKQDTKELLKALDVPPTYQKKILNDVYNHYEYLARNSTSPPNYEAVNPFLKSEEFLTSRIPIIFKVKVKRGTTFNKILDDYGYLTPAQKKTIYASLRLANENYLTKHIKYKSPRQKREFIRDLTRNTAIDADIIKICNPAALGLILVRPHNDSSRIIDIHDRRLKIKGGRILYR